MNITMTIRVKLDPYIGDINQADVDQRKLFLPVIKEPTIWPVVGQ